MRVAVAALALGGCGSSGPNSDGAISGHFVAAATPAGDFQLAVAFTTTNGVVAGYGWAGVPGSGAPPLEPLLVTGQATAGTVSLTLVFADQAGTGVIYGIFSGQGNGSELRGTLSRPAQSLSSVFLRVDTTASGKFEIETTGGRSGQLGGRAGFGTKSPGFRLELGTSGQTIPIVTVVGPQRPAKGIQAVDGATMGWSGTVALPGGGPTYQIVGGTLQVEVSSREALIGTLRGTGRAPGVADFQLTARFSAGCPEPCN